METFQSRDMEFQRSAW